MKCLSQVSGAKLIILCRLVFTSRAARAFTTPGPLINSCLRSSIIRRPLWAVHSKVGVAAVLPRLYGMENVNIAANVNVVTEGPGIDGEPCFVRVCDHVQEIKKG